MAHTGTLSLLVFLSTVRPKVVSTIILITLAYQIVSPDKFALKSAFFHTVAMNEERVTGTEGIRTYVRFDLEFRTLMAEEQ
jgi:hypothetical protein